ncbi:MAG: hypothetical protein CMF25_02165 [Kangiellaceae bacterium]|nr:hypothetical protein [Kangiellaceae bacterium]|tara:strand:- start:2668 stop:3006 length:339 start_codon:yes stop_codon:yes gene_type:complete
MVKHKHSTPSPQTQDEALRLAKANQRPGQTKEQTKLVAQGIQKGIEQYKKQQKAKARERDKQKKKASQQQETHKIEVSDPPPSPSRMAQYLPWGLLIISWIGFIAYIGNFAN